MNLLGYSFHPCKFEQSKDTPGDSTKLCYTSLKFYGQKPRPLKIPNSAWFFLDNPPESPVFFIWHLEFVHAVSFYPWKNSNFSCLGHPFLCEFAILFSTKKHNFFAQYIDRFKVSARTLKCWSWVEYTSRFHR